VVSKVGSLKVSVLESRVGWTPARKERIQVGWLEFNGVYFSAQSRSYRAFKAVINSEKFAIVG